MAMRVVVGVVYDKGRATKEVISDEEDPLGDNFDRIDDAIL